MAYTWTNPKTDWGVTTDSSGNYAGDYYCWKDFNRQKNNLLYLIEYAETMYGNISSALSGIADKNYTDWIYADEMNEIEKALSALDSATYKNGYVSDEHIYTENGPMPDYKELNRIESACVKLKSQLDTQQSGLKMLPAIAGIPNSSICDISSL